MAPSAQCAYLFSTSFLSVLVLTFEFSKSKQSHLYELTYEENNTLYGLPLKTEIAQFLEYEIQLQRKDAKLKKMDEELKRIETALVRTLEIRNWAKFT